MTALVAAVVRVSLALLANKARAMGAAVELVPVAAAGVVSVATVSAMVSDVTDSGEVGDEVLALILRGSLVCESFLVEDAAAAAVVGEVVCVGRAVSADGVGSLEVGSMSTVDEADEVERTGRRRCCSPVTPGATSVDEDVEPVDDAVVSVVAVAVLSVPVDPDTVDDGAADVDGSVDVPVQSAPVEPMVTSALSPVDDDESDVSADASPGGVITAMPIPSAVARAPTRPM